MIGSHRFVVVRVVTMLALITSIWIASARSAQVQTRITPPGDSIADRWVPASTAPLTNPPPPDVAVTGTASSSATPGRTDLTITGSGSGVSRTAPPAVAVSPAGGAGPATATPVVVASGPRFNEEQVRIASAQPLTALTLTITVQTTGGVTFNRQYDTVGSFVQTHSSTASAITYQFTLGAGQVLSAGTGRIFAAQSSGRGTLHPTSEDTYAVTYTAGGASFTVSGNF